MTRAPAPVLAASLALAAGGAMWGLIWLPLRWISAAGVDGAWPALSIFLAAAILLSPVGWLRRGAIAGNVWALLLCGLALGGGFGLYAVSLELTEVVRAILLFYLTPVWGTVIGVLFLGERLTAARVAAIALSLAGLVVVLGTGSGVPLPRNAGDAMALASGVAWAVGSALVYRAGPVGVPEQMLAFVLGGATVAFVLLLATGGGGGMAPDPRALATAAPAVLLSAVYLVPMLFLTVWPTRLLTPGRVGLILMTEVVVAVISAALFSGEPFGWREAAGTVLILGAAFTEVVGGRRRAAGA